MGEIQRVERDHGWVSRVKSKGGKKALAGGESEKKRKLENSRPAVKTLIAHERVASYSEAKNEEEEEKIEKGRESEVVLVEREKNEAKKDEGIETMYRRARVRFRFIETRWT